MQEAREKDLEAKNKLLKKLRSKYLQEMKKYNEYQHISVDGYAVAISSVSQEIGSLKTRLMELEGYEALASELTVASEMKAKLKAEVELIADEISVLERSMIRRRKTVMTEIAENTKDFINLDLDDQNDFEKPENFSFSFEDDWFAINGKANLSTSASGMVVVKNSLFMGLLDTSLQDDQMLFPRLLLLDNIEDKGMIEERVHNFQEVMAKWSNEQREDHQIIITTSTLNPELNKEEYVIGEAYSTHNRTLQLSA